MNIYMLALLLVILFGVFYSLLINRFSNNKVILLLPTILGSLWIIYIIILNRYKPTVGLGGILVLIFIILIFAFIIGNFFSGIYIIYRKYKEDKKS